MDIEVIIDRDLNVETANRIRFNVPQDNMCFEMSRDVVVKKSKLLRTCTISGPFQVKVRHISKDNFRQIAKYMNEEIYTVADEHLFEIVQCALYLKLKQFCDVYCKRIVETMSIENIAPRMVQSFQFSNKTLINYCIKFIKLNRLLVLEDSSIFDIGYFNVRNLLQHKDIFRGYEVKLFEAMVVWIKYQLQMISDKGECVNSKYDEYYKYLKGIPFARITENEFLHCAKEEPELLNYWELRDGQPVPIWQIFNEAGEFLF